jgi:beta-lactamase class A
MNSMRRILLFAVVFVAAVSGQSLQDSLKARIGGFSGTVTLYAKNLDTGVAVGIREADPVRTASTIKLPILLSVFDAVARGKARWTEQLTLTSSDKVSGSGILGSEISEGTQLCLRDVANLMMVLSDNTATNMVLERFSADAVNAYMDTIGIKTTRSMRKVRGDGIQLKSATGWSESGKLPENQKYGLGVSTPRDMVSILEKLERGEIVSADASKDIIAIMKRCRDDSGIRRRMGDLKIANKTGSLDALRSDVGIVYSKGGRIAIAITVDGMPKSDYGPDNVGCLLIADLAKMLVDGLAKK